MSKPAMDQARDWFESVKKRIQTDEETASVVKFVSIGAAGTLALAVVYKMFSSSDRGMKQKLKNSRLRLLNSRRARQASKSKGATTPRPVGAAGTEEIFEQLRNAYVENKELKKHTGGCHCGSVRFIVEAPHELDCIDSDRNMYTLKGRFPHLVVPKSRVLLLTSNDHLGVYHFGNHTIGQVQELYEFQNLFCKNCGVHCFGYNQAKDTMHVNSMCLDMTEVQRVSVAFESDRSTWRVMNPLLYEPSLPAYKHARNEDYLMQHGTEVPAPTDAYDDLTNLGVAAGALTDYSCKNKPSPLLANHDVRTNDVFQQSHIDGPSKRLFHNEDRLIQGSEEILIHDATSDIAEDASPLAQLFSVERLRMHLKKHVQDDASEEQIDRLTV